MEQSLPHKINKDIELLKYALAENKINTTRYFIGFKNEINTGYDQICLHQQENSNWLIYTSGRGTKTNIATFYSHRDAIDYFYWCLIEPQNPWFYRKRWEKLSEGSK